MQYTACLISAHHSSNALTNAMRAMYCAMGAIAINIARMMHRHIQKCNNRCAIRGFQLLAPKPKLHQPRPTTGDAYY